MTDDAVPQDLDPSRIDMLRNLGGPSDHFLGRLVDAFVGEATSTAQALTAAADAGDIEEVGRQAHRLRGSAANIGAAALNVASTDLEHSARVTNPDLALIRAGAARVVEQLQRASAALAAAAAEDEA